MLEQGLVLLAGVFGIIILLIYVLIKIFLFIGIFFIIIELLDFYRKNIKGKKWR